MTATVNGQVDVSTPVLHSLAIRGPRPWVDVTAYGAVGDAVKLSTGGSSVRDSTTVTLTGFSLTNADIGKRVSLTDLSVPSRSSTGAMTSSDNLVTISESAFAATDVGKSIQIGFSGVAAAHLTSTITSYVSATSVRIADNASTTGSSRLVAWWAPQYVGVIASVSSPTVAVMTVAPTCTVTGVEATVGTNDSAAVQAAVDSDAGTVLFSGGPSKTYLLADKITLKSDLRLITDGAVILRHPDAAAWTNPGLFAVPADASNVMFDHLVFDAQHMPNVPLIHVANPTENVTIDGCDFRDVGQGRLVYWQEGNTQHTAVKIHNCWFNRRLPRVGAHADNENLGSVAVLDASYVTIRDNNFIGISSVSATANTPAACTSSNPMQHVIIENNTFTDCLPTTLWFVSVASTYASNVKYHGNTFERCGVWVEKGSMYALLSGTVAGLSWVGNGVRGGGNEGATGGYAAGNSPSLIGIDSAAGAAVSNVTMALNQVDGRTAAGAVPTGNNTGISVIGGVDGLTIADNSVQYLGLHGILASGLPGRLITDLVLDNNRVTRAVGVGSAANPGAGIALLEYITAPVISNNISRANGPVGAALSQTAGIKLGGHGGSGTGGEARADTVTDPIFRGNVCHDNGRSRQVYGIQLGHILDGSSVPVYHPTSASFDANIVSGNLTAGIWWDQTIARGHHFGRNPGFDTGYAHPIYSGSLNYLATATFVIPVVPVPFYGMLIAVANLGDISAVNSYYVFRNASGSAAQVLSASLGILVTGGGEGPTIASTTASTGTFTVTQNYFSNNVTVKVFLLPLTWGPN